MKKLILVFALLALICPFMGMKLYLTNTSSSGQAQSDPNASLGGYRSTTELSATSMKNLFDDVSVVEALLGDTEYRMIDVYNDGTGTAYGVQLYMQTATSSSSTELDFGYSSTNQPHADAWNGEALSNESTAPASPSMSFSNYTKTSPLSLGTIPASQSKRVCVRRTVTAGAPWTAHDLGRFGVRWGSAAAPAWTIDDAFGSDTHTNYTSMAPYYYAGPTYASGSVSVGSGVASGTAWTLTMAYHTTTLGSNNQEVTADLVYSGNGHDTGMLLFRVNTSATTGYKVRFVSTKIALQTFNTSDGGTELGSYDETYGAGTYTIDVIANGTSIEVKVDGTTRISVTDSTYSGNYCGIGMERGHGNSASSTVDNLKAKAY